MTADRLAKALAGLLAEPDRTPEQRPERYKAAREALDEYHTQAPAEGDDMLVPLIYAAIMHNGKPKTVVEFERASATVADMLKRRAAPAGAAPYCMWCEKDGHTHEECWARHGLPHPGSPEASAMIDSELAAHNWPTNSKNAARAGYVACMKLIASNPQPKGTQAALKAQALALCHALEEQPGSQYQTAAVLAAFKVYRAFESIEKHGEIRQWVFDVAAPAAQAPAPVAGPLRAAFESWAAAYRRARGFGGPPDQPLTDSELIRRNGDGTYASPALHVAWEAVQAFAVQSAPEDTPPCWYIRYASHGHITLRKEEADDALQNGAISVTQYSRAENLQPRPQGRQHAYGHCTITGPDEDVAFIFSRLPDADDPSPALAPEQTPAGYNRSPSGEPCKSEDWNAGYEAGLADGKAAAPAPVAACKNCGGKGYADAYTADGEYNPTVCEDCDAFKTYRAGQTSQAPAVGERIAGPLAPHPIADIICAWANGFRVEFRYRHHNPGIPEEIYLSDERWHLCGKAYSAWSGINEHRIHADDLAAWEAFKRAPATPAAEEDHDAWQCDRCNGDGWHWVEHEGVEWRDKVSTKEHCEQCDGLGWLGPDATKAAAAKKGKPPVQGSQP